MKRPHCKSAALALFLLASLAEAASAAFTDTTVQYGISIAPTMSYAASCPDYNGDGIDDLYVGNHWKGPADLYFGLFSGGLIEDSEQYGSGNSDRHDQVWGDFDNDGAPDQYISHGAGWPGTQEKELFWNLGNSVFLEGAAAAGVDDEFGRGREATLADFNNDGWLDFFTVNDFRPGFPRPNRLWWNNGNKTFSEAANDSAVYVTRIHCSSADYNLDGYPDIAVSTPQFQNGELYRNNGNGTFSDVTVSAFPGISLPLKQAQGLSWADYDNDGDLDLFAVGGNTPMWDYCALEADSIRFHAPLEPAETKTVQMITDARTMSLFAAKSDFSALVCYFGGSGASTTTFPMTVSTTTLDGVPPAILTDAYGVFMWSAEKTATLDSIYVVIRGPVSANIEIGGDVQPLDGTILSWEKGNFPPPPPFTVANWTDRLYRNNGNGTFTEVTSTAFAPGANSDRANGAGATWADFDNDGWIDVFVANEGTIEIANQPDYLFRNNGNGTFTEVAATQGVQGPSVGMSDGGAWGDLNNDGFLDLFVNHGAEFPPFGIGSRYLYINTPNANHWLKLELQGIQSNGSGIGARLRFKCATGTRWRTMLGETDVGYGGPMAIHVGLGADTVCDSLQIFWPSGQIDTHVDVAADTKYFAIEGQPLRLLANPHLVLETTAVADTISQAEAKTFPIHLSNSGGAAVHYTVEIKNCAGQPTPWLTISPNFGAIWPGSTPTLTLAANPASLPFGPQCAYVIFHSNDGADADTVNVNLLIYDPNATGVETSATPTRFELENPRPNPMSHDSRTVLALPRQTVVEVAVFDLAGHRVKSLLQGTQPAGYHALTWDGRDERGRRSSPGVYFVRAVAGAESRSRKLILLD
jgi:hypothetical protein